MGKAAKHKTVKALIGLFRARGIAWRGMPLFRVLVWLVLFYVLVGALHGALPQLWYKHYNQHEHDGPFRVLLFTVLITAALILLRIPDYIRVISMDGRPASVYREILWTPLSRRGPPVLS